MRYVIDYSFFDTMRKVRRKHHTLCAIIFTLLWLAADGRKSKDKLLLLYDASLPDYETVLSPSDFEMAAEINDNPSLQKNLVDGRGDDGWDSDAMYNPDKFEGDIANDLNASTVELFIRGAPAGNDSNTQYNAIRDRRQLWPNGRIPYALSSQYSSYSRSVIASAMQEYSKQTCIQWSPRTAADRDYIYIVPDRGCYSLVGRTGGRQTLSLGNGCIQKGIIIHEMMHAVGFFHEQSRTDRDDFITIMWQNILPGMQGQFEKYTSTMIQTLDTEYDYASIMHYGPNAFTRNGMPTMVPKKRASIGQRAGFSKIDNYKINTLYNCPNYNGSQPQTPNGAIFVPQTVARPTYITTTTAPPMLLTTVVPLAATTARRGPAIQPPPSSYGSGLNSGVVNVCQNVRPDCDQLARQGWCSRNGVWMKENCALSCGMCNASSNNIVASRPSVSTSGGVCEDLRVDCAELAKRRYCITAQTFTRVYCARFCGFCFVPPVTETPDMTGAAAAAAVASGRNVSVDASVKAVTISSLSAITVDRNGARVPLATFWPTLRPSTAAPPSSAAGGAHLCRDRRHFCVSWKKSGFCQGIFTNYMRKNCSLSCGWCAKSQSSLS